MDGDKLLAGLDASDLLIGIFDQMRESIKTAQEPIEVGDWDVVTVRGELRDMREYLDMAIRQNKAIRSSFVDLIALIRRLQTSYHRAYTALKEVEQETPIGFQASDFGEPQRSIRDIDAEMTELLMEIVHSLDPLTPEDRASLIQHLQATLKRE